MYIVDGYNFIYKIPELKSVMVEQGPREARLALDGYLLVLAPKLGKRAADFMIIYDGNDAVRGGGESGQVRAAFSRGEEDADAHLIRCVRESSDPRSIVVISDDNQVANNARVHGAKVLRAQELQALVKKRGRGMPKRRDGDDDPKRIPNKRAINESLKKEWGID